MIRSRLFPCCLALAFAFVADGARAAPSTPYFDALGAELTLRAQELEGSTEPEALRQLAAIEKALAALDKPSDSLLQDLKTAGKLAKTLGKAFPGEIPAAEGSLGTLLETLFTELHQDVGAAVKDASTAVNALPEVSCKAKAELKADKAFDALAAASGASDHVEHAKTLRKALKRAGKVDKATSKCDGSLAGGCGTENAVDVAVDTVAFPFANAGFHRGDDVQSLVVNASNPGQPFDELNLVAWGVDGKGNYAVEASSTFTRAGDVTFGGGSIYTVTGALTVKKFVYSDNGVVDDCFAGFLDVTFTNGAVTNRIKGSFELSQPLFP